MRIEITKECILIAIAAYLLGLMMDSSFKGLIALLFFLLVFGIIKDFVDGLFNKKSEDEPNPTSKQLGKSQSSAILNTLKDNERKIVEVLINHGEMTQAELAARVNIPKSTLSRMLKDLETRGIIIRYDSGMTKTVKLNNQLLES